MEFRIKINEEEQGPYALKELKSRLAAGKLSPDTPVRPEKGGGEFVPLSDWVSPEEIVAGDSVAAPGEKAIPAVKRTAKPAFKIPAKKAARAKSGRSATPGSANGKKELSAKNRLIAAVGSMSFAVILILVFLFFWNRTGVEFLVQTHGATLLMNGEEVPLEEQTFRERRMAPGQYDFAVRHEDPLLEDWESTVTVRFGQIHQSSIELTGPLVQLHLESEEEELSFVLFDNEDVVVRSGNMPESIGSLPLGSYLVVFSQDEEDLDEIPIRLHPENPEGVEVLSSREFRIVWQGEGVTVASGDAFGEFGSPESVAQASFSVTTSPGSVRVRIFGPENFSWNGETPVSFNDALPGDYEIEFRAEGWEVIKEEFSLRAGSDRTIRKDFSGGKVTIITEPEGALVRHGNRIVGRTPVAMENLPYGNIEVEIGFPGQPFTVLEGRVTSTPLVLGARFSGGSWQENETRYEN